MTAHRIRYEGPPELAVEVATLLADADGVDLTSSESPQPGGDERSDAVVLALVLDGTTDAVLDAVGQVRSRLPDGATIAIDGTGS